MRSPFSLVAVVGSPITPLLLISHVTQATGSLSFKLNKLPSGCAGGYSAAI